MSQIRCYEGPAPSTPPSGIVTLYVKADKRWYFMADDGIEVPLKPTGVGSGDLLSDGTVPLAANWNAVQSITGYTWESTATTGTPPLVVASTTLVPNLNADLLDGNEATAFATSAQGALADTALQSNDLTGYLQQTDINSLAELNAIVLDATLGDSADFATAAQGTLADGAVQAATYDAHTILAATTDNTPAALTVAEDTFVGRLTGGNIDALTVTEVKTLLGITDLLSASNNVQTGTTYTIQASDNGKNIIFTNAAAIAVTLPDTLDTDFQCTIIQAGAGVPTVTPNTDTINGAGTGVTPAEQWKGMYLTQYAATEWLALL